MTQDGALGIFRFGASGPGPAGCVLSYGAPTSESGDCLAFSALAGLVALP